MSKMIKQLTEKGNDLITRAESIVDKAELEKRELTEDEAAELAEIRDDVREIKKQLGLVKEVKEMEIDKEAPAKVEVEQDGDKEIEVKETRAFEAYIRGIADDIETRDDNTPLSKTGNGAVIPTTIAKRIIAKVYDICPVLERSDKYNAKGKLQIPYYGEDSTNFINVAYQGNAFSKLSANSGSFTSISLEGFVAGALALVDRSLINNAEFPIVDYIVDRMAYSIKRFIEHELLIGTSGKVAGLSGVTLTKTAAAKSAVTADELIQLHDSIKDQFQDGSIWIMSPSTRTAIRSLKDNMGRYMLQDDISLPFGQSLLGKPVFVSDNMPNMGTAGAKAIYYGNLKGLATKFTENMSIEVLREKYADQHADGVIAWLELDAKVQDAQQIAALVMGSTDPTPAQG